MRCLFVISAAPTDEDSEDPQKREFRELGWNMSTMGLFEGRSVGITTMADLLKHDSLAILDETILILSSHCDEELSDLISRLGFREFNEMIDSGRTVICCHTSSCVDSFCDHPHVWIDTPLPLITTRLAHFWVLAFANHVSA